MKNLPPVSEMMRAAGLEPKKQFGQNFLFDLNLTGRIARSVPNIAGATVLEVGPGPGGLTRALLDAGAARVIAIEKDRATEPILREIQAASDGRLELIFGDALALGHKAYVIRHNEKYAICANLPYNVGTELLVRWLTDALCPMPYALILMFQREVAERIVAKAGDKQYGRLAVLTTLVADAKILFDVKNTAFYPPPKVQSAVVQIIPKNCPPLGGGCPRSGLGGADIEKIGRLTAKLFGQRRKMIRGIMPEVDWSRFDLTGAERAENLSPEKFAEIANAL